MASEESTLFSKLQSPDLTNIHHLYTTYLHPFTTITPSTIRPLAKKFLPFLNKSLSILPKRLSETPKLDSAFAVQLFDIYKLCLSCLESISSQLAGNKPYSIHIQKIRFIHCLENCSYFNEAVTEGFLLLESLIAVGEKCKDKELGLLIGEVVITLVKCTSLGQTKNEDDYRRILDTVHEIQPWLSVVDKNDCENKNECEKLRKMIVTYLSKCALFLVGDLACFDKELVCEFCSVIFKEFAELRIEDQMFKFARRICYILFSLPDNLSSSIVDILKCVFKSMSADKFGLEKIMVEYFELVHYCANKCRIANADVCGAVALYFHKLAGYFCEVNLCPFQLVMRLYASGLFISDRIRSKPAKDVVSWLNEEETLLKSTVLASLLTLHNNVRAEEHDLPFRAAYKKLLSQKCVLSKSNCQAAICTLDRRTYMLSYYSALNFLCEPLSEVVNSKRKEILTESERKEILTESERKEILIESASHLSSATLSLIQDAFHNFCNLFCSCYSVSGKGSEIIDDTNKIVLTVAVATLTLSVATKRDVKESVKFLKRVISADWVQANGLKFLFTSLYNVGVVLYKSNRLKEASKALKLCCKAAWTHVLHLSKMSTAKTNGHNIDLSEEAIQVFVGEVCSKSTFLLDVLFLCGSDKAERIIADCLKNWSDADSLFRNLPEPIGLVKQWVRIKCEPSKAIGLEHSTTTLYSLLASKVSKRALGILLEQELLAYSEMHSLNPEICKKMQTTVISILLKDVYITKDSYFQKSRVLIAKARECRNSGAEGLNDSIQYLSEAISTLEVLNRKTSSSSLQGCNQLADAYFLRALCAQEADPNSKGWLTDIKKALKIWVSPDEAHQADQNPMVVKNTLILVYHVTDLLSLKGYMEFHSKIYEMLIRLFEWKKTPKEKWLAMLWHSRRLTHALCASPMTDVFITALSKHYHNTEYEVFKSMKFWTSFGSDVTIEEARKAASNLTSTVHLPSSTAFLAAYLNYDRAERLISNGLLTEALLYSKEAHRLRSQLFKDNFLWSTEQQNVDGNGNTIQKACYSLKTLHMHPSVATSAWSYLNTTCDFDKCILTPWIVLQCYLESILQVATIHETVGNGSEAETLLLWGKNIASFQGLPLFVVAFSSVLGKLYLKQQLWDIAEKELESAKQVLDVSYPKKESAKQVLDVKYSFCKKCRLVFEVTIDQHLGDLLRSRFHSTDNESLLLKAEKVYKSALSKLNTSEWGTSIGNPGIASPDSTVPPTRNTRSSLQKRSKDVADACNEMKCWHCFVLEVMKSGSLNDSVQMEWEFVRRRLLLRLLTRIGKCYGARGDIHEAHKMLFDSISVFVTKCTFLSAESSDPFTSLRDFIGNVILGDVLAIEHASILYNICWFTLKSSSGKGTRESCCAMSCIPIPSIVSWLKLAFTRCREIPVLFQKISRLLSVIYTLSTSIEGFSMRSSCDAISEGQWASYFHQASLGCHLNHQLFSHNIGKQKVQNHGDDEGSSISTSASPDPLRPAPELPQDVERFFKSLPCVTIICISLLGGPYVSLVRELLHYPSTVHAWILLSRFNGNAQPVVILLPVDSIIKDGSDEDEGASSRILCEGSSSVRQWHCPWGYTVVDDVAPVFKQILNDNYLSSSVCPLEDTKENRALWWMHRKRLDQCLDKFLRNLQDSWFGPWKYLFLGELSDCKDPLVKESMDDLKKRCYAGGIWCCSDKNSTALLSKSKAVESLSPSIGKDSVGRDPIILVLDLDVQMLPWENLPVLRNQEVYRMPSVASISSTLDRCCERREEGKSDCSAIPLIDPLDAYYLLNPSGDLSSTEAEFGNWFRDQNILEGKTGTPASVKELSEALSKHDLFIYFGHGSGAQYIPGHEIQKIEKCAATFLMGCSSGSISLNGSCTPHGAPLYYLLAGSPVIVANLWEVTDKDIDRFGKAMLDAWLRERSNPSMACPQCIADKIEAIDINDRRKGNRKKKTTKKKLPETESNRYDSCKHKPRIGSFMSQAREACTLPFLIGASPVCYGVPTGIRNKGLTPEH